MAISSAVVWEVDGATGSDSNGGGFVAGGSGVDKTQGPGRSVTTRSDLACAGIGAPAAPTLSTSSTGGSVAAGTYYFVTTYLGSGGETLASTSASVTTIGSTSTITIASPAAAPGATSYKTYGGLASGGPYYLQGPAGGSTIGTPLVLTSVASSGANPPATDTSGVNVTSAANPFAASDVGNLIQVPSGVSGWTAGFYQVIAFDATTGKATLDRAPAAAGATAGQGTLGGALATVGKLAAAMTVASNRAFIKASATYTTTGLTFSTPGVSPSNSTSYNWLTGYGTTRGDNGQATIQLTSGNSVIVLSMNTSGWLIENLIIDANNQSNCSGLWFRAPQSQARNVVVKRTSAYGVVLNQGCQLLASEVTACSGSASVYLASIGTVAGCYIHDNAAVGINTTASPGFVFGNVIARCTGSSIDGVAFGAGSTILRNTIYACGRSGAYGYYSPQIPALIKGNVFHSNGGAGLQMNAVSPDVPADWAWDGNAYYANNGGVAQPQRAHSDGVPIGVAYTNTLDVLLTADPFVNAAANDYRLNSVAGGGAAARAKGWPSSIPGLTNLVGYPDMGAFQHQDSGTVGYSRSRVVEGV